MCEWEEQRESEEREKRLKLYIRENGKANEGQSSPAK